MRLLLLLLLASCSCAHAPKVNFTDASDDSELGWVCVPMSSTEWACEDIRTFAKRLQKSERDHGNSPTDM